MAADRRAAQHAPGAASRDTATLLTAALAGAVAVVVAGLAAAWVTGAAADAGSAHLTGELGATALLAAALAAAAVRAGTHPAAQPDAGGDLEALLATSPDAVVIVDEHDDVVRWNPAAEALLGWSAQEALGRGLADLVVPGELRAAHRRGLTRFAATGHGVLPARPLEMPAVRKDGTRIVVEMTVGSFAAGGGRWFHAVLRDVTARREQQRAIEGVNAVLRSAEAEARQQSELLDAVMNSISDGVVVLDENGDTLVHNEAARAMLAADDDVEDPTEWLQPSRLLRPGTLTPLPPAELPLARALAGSSDDAEVVVRRPGPGADVTVAVSARPLDPRAGLGGVVAVFQDVTHQRRIEDQLHRQAAVFASIHDAVLISDADGTLVDCNPAAEALTGLSRATLLARGLGELAPASAGHRSRVLAHLRAHGSWHGDVSFRRADGSTGIAESVTVAVRDGAGRLSGTISVNRDATAAREAAEALRETEERFRLAFDRSPAGMVLTDLTAGSEGRVLRVNDAYCRLLGREAAELLHTDVLSLTHPDDVERDRQAVAALVEGREDSLGYEKRYLHADGRTVWVAMSTSVVTRGDGSAHYAVTQVDDVTARRAEAERLTALALQDPLTGLGNRVLLMDRLRQALHRAERSQRPLAVLFCDLNGFKPVNDTHGHAAGDELLRTIGARIRECVRPADTVSRLGGDEFVVLCEDLESAAAAERIAERVRVAVSAPQLLGTGEEVRVGVSIGIALSDAATPDAAALLAAADVRMYEAKATARVGR